MSFFYDLKNGNFSNIIIVIIVLLVFHLYWIRDNKEPMAEISNNIKEAIKQVYLVDVDAIRNLSEVATNLNNKNGLIVPANLDVKGNLTSQSNLFVKNGLDLNGFKISGTSQNGLVMSRKDGRATHFDFTDNKNYIRGDTIIDGNLCINGVCFNQDLLYDLQNTQTGRINLGSVNGITKRVGLLGNILVPGQGTSGSSTVTFPKPFKTVIPKITLSPVLLDTFKDRNLRFDIKATNITKNGFDFNYIVWADTLLYGFSIGWTAHP